MTFYGNIDPQNLIGLIKNSASFLFSKEYESSLTTSELFERYPNDAWQYIINSFLLDKHLPQAPTKAERWYEYFLLCLSAHWSSVMTFVPTDVDNKIRAKLWLEAEKKSATEKMIQAVIRLPNWDMSRASRRFVVDDELGVISGHNGEYLTVLAGALGHCLANQWEELAVLVEAHIDRELERETLFYRKYLRFSGEEIKLLKICTIMTHNIGDLARVLDMWLCEESIVFKYKRKYLDLIYQSFEYYHFFEAGKINKEFTVHDNGRHLALRAPKFLRTSEEFLLPIGPFFEEWAEQIARNPLVKEEEIIHLINSLLDGIERIPLQRGYTRALAGLNRILPRGIKYYEKELQKQRLITLRTLKIEEESKITTSNFNLRLSKKVRNFIEEKLSKN